jgi:hypothetical protein
MYSNLLCPPLKSAKSCSMQIWIPGREPVSGLYFSTSLHVINRAATNTFWTGIRQLLPHLALHRAVLGCAWCHQSRGNMRQTENQILGIHLLLNPLVTIATFLGQSCLNLQGIWNIYKTEFHFFCQFFRLKMARVFEHEYFHVFLTVHVYSTAYDKKNFNSA